MGVLSEQTVQVQGKTAQVINGIAYVDKPFYLNIWFALAVVLIVAVIVLSLYLWFRIYLRNRTNVIIHMPDGTRQLHGFNKFVGDCFNIQSHEKDKHGSYIQYRYIFKPECLEQGFFGRYIEYDYAKSEPLNPRKREYDNKDIPELFKRMSALMNSEMLINLLLSQKFKEFITTMLIIILVVCIIIAILIAIGFFYQPTTQCTLVANNQTINTLRFALGK